MNHSGHIGVPYRPIPPNGWQHNNTVMLYSPFTIGTNNTSSYLIQDAINTNAKMPDGVLPITGSPYTRILHVPCGSDEDCYITPGWCCDNTNSMVSHGCPHIPWFGINPKYHYNVTFPYTASYPTASIVTKSLCEFNLYGYKNLQSSKVWHGANGFLDYESNNCNDTEVGTCSIYYRTYKPTLPQTLYLGMEYSLDYSYSTDFLILSGSWDPCNENITPYTVIDTIPSRRGVSSATRNILVDRYSGEFTQNSMSINEKLERYWVTSSLPTDIYDPCGNLYLSIDTNRWWTTSETSGTLCKYYDLPDMAYDEYGNPVASRPCGPPEYYEGNNILSTDYTAYPGCSDNLPVFISLITQWNNLSGQDNYGASSGSGIILPTLPISGTFTATDSYGIGMPGNGDTVTCSIDPLVTYTHSEMSDFVSSCTVTITRTNTSYDFSISYGTYTPHCGGFAYSTVDYSGTVSLTNAYTAADVQADLDVLLSKWDLNDNDVYPLRTDGYCQIAPLVTYNEILIAQQPFGAAAIIEIDDYRNPKTDVYGNTPFSKAGDSGQFGPPIWDGSGYPPFASCWTPTYGSPQDWVPTYFKMSWFDQAAKSFYWNGTGSVSDSAADGIATLYDNSIIGLPSVITGSGSTPKTIQTGNWNWRHEVWKFDYCNVTLPKFWYLNGVGELNIGQFGIPLTATQWPNNYVASFLPPYAFNLIFGKTARKQKWMEIKQVWPSWDFNRPYGQDKFTPDETAVSCYSDYTSSIGSVGLHSYYVEEDPEDDPGNFTDVLLNPEIHPTIGDVWGGTDVNGFFDITGVSGDGVTIPWSVTTGSLVLPLPTGYPNKFCRLRWPYKPDFGTTPILVTSSSGSNGYTSSIHFQTAQNQYLSSSVVDLYVSDRNPQGLVVPSQTPTGSSITIHYIDDYNASCSGDFHTAEYLISTGLKNWWCDNQPKGQVVKYEWVRDNRTIAELNRLSVITDCEGNTSLTGSLVANNGFSSFSASHVSLSLSTVIGVPTKDCSRDCAAPGVICYSNNGETFNSRSITYPIPTIHYDTINNSAWQAEIVQVQEAFDFQVPHKVCFYNPNKVRLRLDPGECNVNQDHSPTYYEQFYGFPTQYEPFLTLPTTKLLNGSTDTAPDPAVHGFKWTTDNIMITSSGVTPIWPGVPVLPVGYPIAYMTPWLFTSYVCNSLSPCSYYDYSYVNC